MKLLVRAPNWLGDAVMAIPALREIRRANPKAEIAVLAKPSAAPLYRRESFCDRLILDDGDGRHRGLAGRWRLARELRKERFGAALLLTNSFATAAVVWAARIARRIGYDRDGRGLLLTQAIPPPRQGEIPRHQRFYYLELLRRAGWIDRLPGCPAIRLENVDEAAAAGRREWVRRGLPEAPWIGVSPGAAFGGAKRWLPERFAAAAERLAQERDARIAIFGSPAEAPLCEALAAAAGPRAVSLAGQTSLEQFIELAATCELYLSNDSGPMHVASALGVPTVAVFGATDHEATGPAGSGSRIVRRPVECSPCLLRECPIDHRCMTGVGVADVVEAAQAQTARAGRGERTPSSAAPQ